MLIIVVGLFAAGLMFALYLVQRRTGDAGIVDAGWAAGLGLAALWYAVASRGDVAHRLALVFLAGGWSFRLASYLIIDRVRAGVEDGRYQALRARWGSEAPRRFFFFFQYQALFIVIFSIPFLMVALRPGNGLTPVGWLGIAVGVGAVAGESIADRQLRRWRRDPANRGRTCRSGMWRYSRHPNYFFEWLHWWAYVLLCAGTPHVVGALVGPVLMLLFLYRVTGIPYTEAQAVLSRGEDYRAYQRTTSAFFPWFPRKD